MLIPNRLGYGTSHLFEVVIKMGWVLKSQAISNVPNAPVSMLQECFGFYNDPFIDQCARRTCR